MLSFLATYTKPLTQIAILIDPVSRSLLKRVQANGRGPVLLMYHGTPDDEPASRFSTRAARFAAQLDLLQACGWHTARICDLDDPAALPERTAVITFDDGYADNFRGGFEALARRGMTASWFIVSGCVGTQAQWLDLPPAQRRMLSPGQLQEMHSAGMEIGSHTRTHADLEKLATHRLDEEIRGARTDLEDLLGTAVTSFAYPYGRFRPAAVDAVQAAGYRHACTTRAGWYRNSDNALQLRRVAIYRHDSVSSFARKLVFANHDVGWSSVARYAGARLGARLGLS